MRLNELYHAQEGDLVKFRYCRRDYIGLFMGWDAEMDPVVLVDSERLCFIMRLVCDFKIVQCIERCEG